ncbi:hypothetical protein PWT90_02572 [Aphanocladium album]|nr:hypothetical protein PWT90_02572 [Aphanocladium album]
MQFSIVSLFIGVAIATPTTMFAKLAPRAVGVCAGTVYGIPVCCASDVLGLADLTCKNPISATDHADFHRSCNDAGSAAHCCTLDIGGIGLICAEALLGLVL